MCIYILHDTCDIITRRGGNDNTPAQTVGLTVRLSVCPRSLADLRNIPQNFFLKRITLPGWVTLGGLDTFPLYIRLILDTF